MIEEIMDKTMEGISVVTGWNKGGCFVVRHSGYMRVATINPAATLRRVRHEDCFSSLGRPQGGHAMLNPFFQPLYNTVL